MSWPNIHWLVHNMHLTICFSALINSINYIFDWMPWNVDVHSIDLNACTGKSVYNSKSWRNLVELLTSIVLKTGLMSYKPAPKYQKCR